MRLEYLKEISYIRLLPLNYFYGAKGDGIKNEKNKIAQGMYMSIVFLEFYFKDLQLFLDWFKSNLVKFVGIVR